MIIQYNTEGRVDFKAPVFVSEERFDKFVKFFKSLGKHVEIKNVLEPDRFIAPKGKVKAKESWTAKDLILLFDEEMTLSQTIKKTKRSEVAVKMKKAEFVPSFLSWCRKKGYPGPTKEIINKYLEEK